LENAMSKIARNAEHQYWYPIGLSPPVSNSEKCFYFIIIFKFIKDIDRKKTTTTNNFYPRVDKWHIHLI